jgi:hypothetical protein
MRLQAHERTSETRHPWPCYGSEPKPVCPHATGTGPRARREDDDDDEDEEHAGDEDGEPGREPLTPEPQIALRFPKGTSYRVVKAALHRLAAEIELATPASERWCVNTEDFNQSGRVYLELADATPAEAGRGMALLKKLLA